MELREGLLTRRSVRQFIPGKTVSEQDMEDILRCAMFAPSARNCQPWEFIVISDKGICKKITEIHPYCSFLTDAGTAVVVCGNLNEQMADDYWVGDCAAAAENLLLACHSKGLGACWCGIYPNKERMPAFEKLFKLPPHIKPLALIVIGYPERESKQPDNRFRPSKIHYNAY